MNTVSFQNKGLIDPAAITTFGVSVKETDSPIGFFGTGIKYAIAILLRNGCSIEIFAGEEEPYTFDTVPREIRGTVFDIVRMNGQKLGFTLELGKTWEMWQAFRELYCNTVDEQGEVFGNAVPVLDGCTTIVVEGAAFHDEYLQRDQMMLTGEPQHKLTRVDIHATPSDRVHFKGVRVGQLAKPSIFTYNITAHLKLSEDRTVSDMSDAHYAIRMSIIHCEDAALITQFLRAPEGSFEATVDMDWYDKPGDLFMQVVKDTPFRYIHNPTIKHLYKKYAKKETKAPTPVTRMTAVEVEQLKRATDFCEQLNYNVSTYVIHVTEDVPDAVLGMAYEGEIYLARRAFTMGTKMVAATLLEEYIHLDREFADCDYPMQNFLFETLITMGEQLVGEPL